jgi:TatD DNase family protein
MLEKSKAKKVVMHCFSGKKKLVKRIQDNGWTLSIPVIVIKLEQFQETVRTTPLAQLLTETDTPYLGPQAGLGNEPKNVSLAITKIAEIKGMTETEVADQLFMNYMRLFR